MEYVTLDQHLLKDRMIIYKSKFFYLLLALILYFVGTASLTGGSLSNFLLSVLFSLIILTCTYVISHGRYVIFSTAILGIVLFVLHWEMMYFHQGKNIYLTSYILSAIFLLIVSHSVLLSVTRHKTITADSLFGAICGYLLVGFTWTFLYLSIATVNPDAFSKNMLTASIHDTVQHFFYFSFTAMTTLGYGDVVPLSNIARTCSWMEAVTGQIYLAVWISQLVGIRIAQKNGNGQISFPPPECKTS